MVPGSGNRFNGAFQAGQGINDELQTLIFRYADAYPDVPEDEAYQLVQQALKLQVKRDKLKEKFPTAGLAVINFTAGLWSSVDVNSGSLSLFLTPRELKATQSP